MRDTESARSPRHRSSSGHRRHRSDAVPPRHEQPHPLHARQAHPALSLQFSDKAIRLLAAAWPLLRSTIIAAPNTGCARVRCSLFVADIHFACRMITLQTDRAAALTSQCLCTYNQERPHESLGRVPPLTFLPRPRPTVESPFEVSARGGSLRGQLAYPSTRFLSRRKGRKPALAWPTRQGGHRPRPERARA